MWCILNGTGPYQRKCLAGLGDVTAAAMTGFENLKNTAELFKRKDLTASLERGKRYLKTQFQLYCSDNSPVRSHNITFALSDSQNISKRQINLDSTCHDCNNILFVMEAIQKIVNGNFENQELQCNIEVAIEPIFDYIKHLMRDAQQKKAKKFAFSHISETVGFWLKDFSLKVLPVKLREGQKDYYGKRGMSVHTDVFFTKQDGKMKKKVYYTSIYQCDQEISDTLSNAAIVLDKFKDFPQCSATVKKIW